MAASCAAMFEIEASAIACSSLVLAVRRASSGAPPGPAPAGSVAPRARLDGREEGRRARALADLARLARQHDELGLAGEDRFLGAHHVDVDGRICHLTGASSLFPALLRWCPPCRTPARAARRTRR